MNSVAFEEKVLSFGCSSCGGLFMTIYIYIGCETQIRISKIMPSSIEVEHWILFFFTRQTT